MLAEFRRDRAQDTWLGSCGVRPADGVEDEKPAGSEQQRSAVLLNLFLGGGDVRPIRVIEGQAREVGAQVRLAGEMVRRIAEPGSESGWGGARTRFRVP